MFSDTHTLYNKDDAITGAAYWDYTYENIGLEDVSAFVNTIVTARPGACNKVTLVPHSTAVNSALVAAARIPFLSDTVGTIAAVAPCLKVNINEYWLNEQDMETTDMLYSIISVLPSMFGPNHEEVIRPFCESSPINGMICDRYLLPNPAASDPQLKERSLKAYRQVHQNSIQNRFQELVLTGDIFTSAEYDLAAISGIEVISLAGTEDVRCPPTDNMLYFTRIPDADYSNLIFGFDNIDFLHNNSLGYVDILAGLLPLAPTAITADGICPIECERVDSEGYCKCGSDSDDEPCRDEARARKEAAKVQKDAASVQ